jgi:hypothetical protein
VEAIGRLEHDHHDQSEDQKAGSQRGGWIEMTEHSLIIFLPPAKNERPPARFSVSVCRREDCREMTLTIDAKPVAGIMSYIHRRASRRLPHLALEFSSAKNRV